MTCKLWIEKNAHLLSEQEPLSRPWVPRPKGPDKQKSARVLAAMTQMVKSDVAKLQAAERA